MWITCLYVQQAWTVCKDIFISKQKNYNLQKYIPFLNTLIELKAGTKKVKGTAKEDYYRWWDFTDTNKIRPISKENAHLRHPIAWCTLPEVPASTSYPQSSGLSQRKKYAAAENTIETIAGIWTAILQPCPWTRPSESPGPNTPTTFAAEASIAYHRPKFTGKLSSLGYLHI